jgi:hypothetical protein
MDDMEAPFARGRCPPPTGGGEVPPITWTRRRSPTGFSPGGRGRPAYLALLILRAGDVEENPGPSGRDNTNRRREASRGDRRRRPALRGQRDGERRGDLCLMQFNCNGAWARATELRARLAAERPHLVLLQETRLRPDQEAPTLPGYNIAARQDHKGHQDHANDVLPGGTAPPAPAPRPTPAPHPPLPESPVPPRGQGAGEEQSGPTRRAALPRAVGLPYRSALDGVGAAGATGDAICAANHYHSKVQPQPT